jgi:hypothetical protein
MSLLCLCMCVCVCVCSHRTHQSSKRLFLRQLLFCQFGFKFERELFAHIYDITRRLKTRQPKRRNLIVSDFHFHTSLVKQLKIHLKLTLFGVSPLTNRFFRIYLYEFIKFYFPLICSTLSLSLFFSPSSYFHRVWWHSVHKVIELL